MASLPFDDWQFYVVSLLGLGAVFLIVRPFLPGKRKSGCSGCASGSNTPEKRKVKITVDGKRTD